MKYKNFHHLRISTILVAASITVLIGFSLYHEIVRIKRHVVETALMQAEEAFYKDIQYRRWNASHGGVYIEINDTIKPNPYLKVPNRDITSLSGKKYTLMNPAWMTREAYDQFNSRSDIRGHITSLNPINPQNAPDKWESAALQQVDNHVSRVFSTDTLEGELHFRYLRSFVTEKPCLKCHAAQGYKEGDIRGGISISIRLQPIKDIEEANLRSVYSNHVIVWIASLLGLYFWVNSLRKGRNKLIESEARWNFALESAGDAVWDWNVVANEVFFSSQWKSMLGYNEDEIGNTLEEWSSRVHPDDLKLCLEKIERHFKKETPVYSSEHRIRCRDGSYKWVFDRGKVITWTEDGKPLRIIGVHSDITDRKDIEKRIQESDLFLNGILESTADGILAVDNNGKVIKSNKRFAELWKIPQEILSTDDNTILLQYVQDQLVNPNAFIEGIQILYNSDKSDVDIIHFKDGRVFERFSTALTLRNDIVGRVWSFRDVTEKTESLNKIEESERLLKQSQEVSKIGSYVLDITAGEWSGSEVLNDMFGVTKEDDHSIAGWVSVIHPGEQTEMSTYFTNEVLAKKNRFDKEYRIQKKNSGEELWVHGIGELEFDSTGAPIKMIGTIQDITERKIIANWILEKKIQLETLVQNLPGYIYRSIDTPENSELQFVSDGIVDIIGYSVDELMQNKTIRFTDLIYSDDIDTCWDKTFEGLANKKVFEIEYRIATRSGEEKWLWERGRGIYDDTGKYLYTEGYVVDITDRKKVERVLINSENKFRLIWENSLDAMRLADENGKIVLVNPAFCDLVSKSKEELIGYSIASVYRENEERTIRGYCNNFKNRTANPHFENEMEMWNGVKKFVEVGHTFLDIPDQPTLLLSVFNDVTIRRHAQLELHRERTLLRTVIDNIPDPIYVKDLHGKKILANIADAHFAGKHTVEEVLGKTDAELYPIDIAEHSRFEEETILQSGVSLKNYEGNFVSSTGEKRWLVGNKILLRDENGTSTGILGINHDITERKIAEEKNRMLAHTVESISEAVTVTDLDTKLLYVNKAFTNIYGYTRDEVIGKHIGLVWSENNLHDVSVELTRETNKGGWKGELLNISKDGREFPIHLNTSQVKNELGEVVALVGVAEDISEKKKSEQYVIESEKNLRRAESVALFGNWKVSVNDKIVHASDGAKNIFGFENNIVTALEIFKCTLPEYRPLVISAFKQLVQGADPMEAEIKIKRKSDGAIRDIYLKSEHESNTNNVFGVIHDITRQKQSETAAVTKDSENRFLAESLLKLSECQTENDVFLLINTLLKKLFPNILTFISRFTGDSEHLRLIEFNNVDLSKLATLASIIGFDPIGSLFKVSPLFKSIYTKPILQKFDNGLTGLIADNLSQETIQLLEKAFDVSEVYTIGISQGPIDFGFINIVTTTKSDPFSTSMIESLTNQCALALSKLASLKLVLQSEEKYRMLIYGNEAVMLVIDPVNGSIVEANPAACRFYGYTNKQMLSMKISQINTLSQEQIANKIQQIATGQEKMFKSVHVLSSGEKRFVQVFSTPVMIDNYKFLHSIVVDITEEKEWENKLIESEEKYRELVEGSPDAIAVYTEGKVVYVNESSLRLMRATTVDELLGKTIFDFVHPDYREFVAQRMKQSTSAGKALPLAEERFMRLDGTDVDVEVKAIPVKYNKSHGVQLIIRDITERKKAIEAISASKVFVKDILNSLTESIAVLDENGTIIEVNKAWMDFGFINHNLDTLYNIGSNYYDVCKRAVLIDNDSYAQQAYTGITAVASRTAQFFSMEYPCSSPSEERWFLMRVSPMTGPRKGVVVSHENITDRKKIQLEINELNEHLEEKIEERTRQLYETNKQLETFSYSVSHDLRAPLRAIDSFSRILLEEELERISDNGKRQISLIRGNTLRMSRLIDDLLEFSRTNRSELKRMPFDMNVLVTKVLKEFTSAESERTIETTIHQMPKLNGDPSLFRQVFINLIGNAIKFSKHRDVSTIEIGGFESEYETTYFIKDNGAGFDMRYADKLFGVFQRLHTEAEYEGTGVGLAIVQRIIQRHGGTIKAESTLDNGTTFTFTIPRLAE